MKISKYPVIFSWSVVFLVFILHFLYFAVLNRYHLAYQEQIQLFRFDRNYFLDLLAKQGGISEYIGSFLIQFYLSAPAAAMIVTFVTIVTFFLYRFIFNKLVIKSILWPLLPVYLLVILQSDYVYYVSYTIGFLLAITFFLLYISLKNNYIRFVAFSVNKIMQVFHAVPGKKIEVIDTLSDLILYDSETNVVSQCESIASKERFETFPVWSPDGKYLYFCSAKAMTLAGYDKIKYDLLRVCFNPETQKFSETDTILSSVKTGMSISFPSLSPDGKYILFCMSRYGNFTIWHSDSDLFLFDIEKNEMRKLSLNSDQSDSYHSWSSNGRWIIFGSRRSDGLYTRLWLSYFSQSGETGKPFIMPQKNPDHYDTFLKSYNRPEFVTSKVKLNPRILSKYARTEPLNASFMN
ncbi:MAG: DUF6057 family protein [Bacteroidales bacterium]